MYRSGKGVVDKSASLGIAQHCSAYLIRALRGARLGKVYSSRPRLPSADYSTAQYSTVNKSQGVAKLFTVY
jgi:hypothetical protein